MGNVAVTIGGKKVTLQDQPIFLVRAGKDKFFITYAVKEWPDPKSSAAEQAKMLAMLKAIMMRDPAVMAVQYSGDATDDPKPHPVLQPK